MDISGKRILLFFIIPEDVARSANYHKLKLLLSVGKKNAFISYTLLCNNRLNSCNRKENSSWMTSKFHHAKENVSTYRGTSQLYFVLLLLQNEVDSL